jgi:PPK2 family polyphosphate:nucleotide phosphotransferase
VAKKQPLQPPVGAKVKLSDYDPAYAGGLTKGEALDAKMEKDLERLSQLQEAFYAEGKRALLVILQAIDTGGKDGTIRHVFRGLDPHGVQVTAFKQPSEEELAHDFLWRVHKATPRKGLIGVFNRSHYEDVLIVRVHGLVPESVWRERYDHINRFEEMLTEHGTTILKFFLYISKDEQKKRLEERRDTPDKRWKFSLGDLKERQRWDEYMAAYEDMLTKCNTPYARWHIVPANRKWYRNYIVTRTLVETLENLNPQFPQPESDYSGVQIPE